MSNSDLFNTKRYLELEQPYKSLVTQSYHKINSSRKIKTIEDEWAKYKYLVLERSHGEKFEDSFEDTILKKEITYENRVHIKVKFDRRAAFRVYDELNGKITEDDDGNLYTEIAVPNDRNLYSYIFSFGDSVEVLDPKETRLKIKEMINKMSEKYIT